MGFIMITGYGSAVLMDIEKYHLFTVSSVSVSKKDFKSAS